VGIFSGAERRVIWLVLREVLVLTVIGIAVGLPASFLLTKLVQSQLYGVDGHDPLTLATAVILIAAIAVVAGYAPGRRATKIHPMEALRCD
jgi:macrolide transport system ATP-binding/permease protein